MQHYTITGRYTRRYVNLLLPLLLVFPYKGEQTPNRAAASSSSCTFG